MSATQRRRALGRNMQSIAYFYKSNFLFEPRPETQGAEMSLYEA